jgi:membrane protease YdiL (CAAX protease family)
MYDEQSLFSRIAKAIGILAVFAALSYALPAGLIAIKAGSFLKQLGIPHYTNLFSFVAAGIVLTIAVVMILRRIGPVRALGELGLTPLGLMPILAGLLAVVAMAVAAMAMGRSYQPQDPTTLIALGVVSPIGEEILFRGFVFRQLRRWAALPFWMAALIAAAVFASEHWSQGDTLISSFEASSVTFAGGFLFCWLTERWNSIWPGIIIHAGLNIVWEIFALGDNAIGDATANIARLVAIVVAIAATMLLTSRPERVPA